MPNSLIQVFGSGTSQTSGNSTLLGETIEDVDKFREALTAFRSALFDPIRDAPLDVISEDREADAIERRFGRGELLENIDAESRLLYHPPDPSNLPFDSIEPGHERLLLRLVQHVSRSLFLQGLDHYTVTPLKYMLIVLTRN